MSNWQNSINDFFNKNNEETKNKDINDFTNFVKNTALPALREIRDQMEKHGREVVIRETVSSLTARIIYDGKEEFIYGVYGRLFPNGMLPYAEVKYRERNGLKITKVETMIRSGKPDYLMSDVTKNEVIENFLGHYMRVVKP